MIGLRNKSIEQIPLIVDQLMGLRKKYLLAFTGSTIGTAVLLCLWQAFGTPDEIRWMIVFLATALLSVAYFWVVEHRYNVAITGQIMPLVAGTLDLTYSRNAEIPQHVKDIGFLPSGDREVAQDEIRGTVGGHPMTGIEVKIFRDGSDKKSRTMFRGFLIRMQCANDLNFVARADLSDRDGVFRKAYRGAPANMGLRCNIRGQSQNFEVWHEKGNAPDPIADFISLLDHKIGPSGALFGVMQTGTEAFLAVRFPKDAFSMGTLFDNREVTIDKVRKSLDDLLIPTELSLYYHELIDAFCLRET